MKLYTNVKMHDENGLTWVNYHQRTHNSQGFLQWKREKNLLIATGMKHPNTLSNNSEIL